MEPAWLDSRSCRRCSSSDNGRAGRPAGLGLPVGAELLELAWPRGAVGKLAVGAGAALLFGVVDGGAGEPEDPAGCVGFCTVAGTGAVIGVCCDTAVDAWLWTGATRSQLADCFFNSAAYLRKVRKAETLVLSSLPHG